MMQTLWLAGLLIANLWAAGEWNAEYGRIDPDPVQAEPNVVAVKAMDKWNIVREETPILCQIPIVGPRLFCNLGYKLVSDSRVPTQFVPETVEQPSPYTPILPPIKAGEKPCCENPPTNQEILRALPTLAHGIPYVYDQYRDDMEFTVEKLVDRVDEPRFFPLIGPAQLHHCHWKCTVSFTEVIEITHPFPFTSKTRHTEVVYIDTDRLHLVAQPQQENAPPQSCPGGHYRPIPKAATRAESPRQVQMEITIVSIDRAAIPEETYRRVRKELGFDGENGPGVTKDRSEANKVLQKLMEDGFVDLLARPNILTMSDRVADFETGNIALNILPVVKADGRIHLKTSAHLTVTQLTKDGGLATFGSTAEAVALMADGQTISFGGLRHKEVTLTQRGIPLLSELPYVGDFFNWNQRLESERELLIIVTPRIVTRGDAAETAEPPLHDTKATPAPVPASGKIYVVVDAGDDGQQVTVLPAAEQTVLDAIESIKSLQADKVRKVRVSRISSDNNGESVMLPVDWKAITEEGKTASNYQLEAGDRVLVYVDAAKIVRSSGDVAVKVKTLITYGTLRPPFDVDSEWPNFREVPAASTANDRKVLVIVDDGKDSRLAGVVAFEGQSVLELIAGVDAVTADNVKKICVMRPAADGNDGTTLPIDWKQLTRSGRCGVDLLPGDSLRISLEPANSSRQGMSLDDVVRMSKAGVSAKIILRQMEMTNAVFDLTCDDIVYLREQGVSNRIISAMQERRTSEIRFPTAQPMSKYSTKGYPEQAFARPTNPDKQDRREHEEQSADQEKNAAVAEVLASCNDRIQFVEDSANDGKRLPGLVAKVYLATGGGRSNLVEANGCLHVEIHDVTSNTPVKIVECRFDAETLKVLSRVDKVGLGYTLFLPWDGYRKEIEKVEMRVVYMPENGGQPQHAEPQLIRLKNSEGTQKNIVGTQNYTSP